MASARKPSSTSGLVLVIGKAKRMTSYYFGYALSVVLAVIGLVFAGQAIAEDDVKAYLEYLAGTGAMFFLSGYHLNKLIGYREIADLPGSVMALEDRASALKRVSMGFQQVEEKFSQNLAVLEEVRSRVIGDVANLERQEADARQQRQLVGQLEEQLDQLLSQVCELRASCWSQAETYPAVGNIGGSIDPILSEHGITVVIPSEGEAHNTRCMRVESREVNEGVQEGSVVRCLRPGFRLADGRLLPASVVLADSVLVEGLEPTAEVEGSDDD